MGKTEHSDKFKELVTELLETDLDTCAFAQVLGVSEQDLDFFSSAEEKNIDREKNFASMVAYKKSLGVHKNQSVQEAIKEFQTSKESTSGYQYIQRASVELKMLTSGLKNPKQILDLLAENTAVHTFYDIDTSKVNPKVKSFHYDKISPAFMQFIAEFDNPTLLLDRLNRLKINVSVSDIEAQREKAKELLNIICQVPEEHFQKAVNDLNQFGCIGKCDIVKSNTSDPAGEKILDEDFIARLKVLEKGGLDNEDRELLQALDDDCVVCPSLADKYGLETVLDNKQLLKSLHIILSEEVRVLKRINFSQDIIDKVSFLEKKGVLHKLSTILSAGIVFSNIISYEYGKFRPTIMGSVDLEKENNELLSLVELTYDNLTNKEFILMRSYLGIYTILDSDLVRDGLQLFQQIKKQIEALSLIQKKKLFKSLSANGSYFSSVPHSFSQTWGNWQEKCVGVVDDPHGKVMMIMRGILELDDDLNKSHLESAIRQQQSKRKVDTGFIAAVTSINQKKETSSEVYTDEDGFLPIDVVCIDKDHVVDQSMDIIQLSESKLRIQLVLTQKSWLRVLQVLQEDPDDPNVFESSIRYSSQKIPNSVSVTNALSYKHTDGVLISVCADDNIRATIGLVDISIDLSRIDKDSWIQEINSALSYLVGSGADENLLSPTDEQSDQVLNRELYKLNTKETTPPSGVIFERRDVFNGYQTSVIPDRHKVLKERYDSFVTFHNVHDASNLLQLLTHGIFSSHERYRRGRLITGLSTWEDFERGGANSVFTRTFSVASEIDLYGINLIFDSKIWDRLDFYIYDRDNFGDTGREMLKTRLSPDEYLSKLRTRAMYDGHDEQMFRRGIPTDMIKGIVVSALETKNDIITQLTNAGISSVNGKSLDDFIYVDTHTSNDVFAMVDIAEGLPLGTTQERKAKEKILKSKPLLEGETAHYYITEVATKDLNAKQIIDTISNSDPYLEEQFQSSAHVSEGYTIREHAQIICGQYEKYFTGKHDIFSLQEMRVGLSLHGIGKNLKFYEKGSTEDHFLLTKHFALSILSNVGFTFMKKRLMSQILSQDFIGEYLRSGDSEEVLMSSATTIIDISKKSGVAVRHLFNLIKIYFMCVESSHTKDVTGEISYIDSIGMFDFSKPDQLTLAPEFEKKVAKIYNKILDVLSETSSAYGMYK